MYVVDEKYALEDYDEKILEIMQNYEYDYEKIAKEIFRGKIDFTLGYIYKRKYEKLYSRLTKCDSFYDGFYELEKNKKIKYEKGILMIGDYEINDVNDISEIFNILVECLTEHGEYLKRYLQKKSELDKKLGFLDE